MVWPPVNAGQFLDACVRRGERLYPLYHLVTTRGLRRGEACGIRREDSDLTASKTLMVLETGDDGLKSDSSWRTIAVGGKNAGLLTEWRLRQKRERLAAGPAWVDSGPIFTAVDGSALREEYVCERFTAICSAEDLPPIRFHDLRHCAATIMLAAGVDMKYISATLATALRRTCTQASSPTSPRRPRTRPSRRSRELRKTMIVSAMVRQWSGIRPTKIKEPCPVITGQGSHLRRIGDLNPGWAVNPNRISSSVPDRSRQSHVDPCGSAVLLERGGTARNCNPNCNLCGPDLGRCLHRKGGRTYDHFMVDLVPLVFIGLMICFVALWVVGMFRTFRQRRVLRYTDRIRAEELTGRVRQLKVRGHEEQAIQLVQHELAMSAMKARSWVKSI
ncbi:tyrosine-type recombinase/integrase [Nonomuraea sp. NPDC050451]|uniref:tyrosine-type recombinase/integrase n=1 Tax=Nonomuraea sp. NPDC050451 TaxID=3364364 RepID=UPI0037B6DEAA